MAKSITFSPVKLQWPEQSTAWLNELAPLKSQIATKQTELTAKIDALASLMTYHPSDLATKAQQVITSAEANLAKQFDQAPFCLAVTPFQMGVGTGEGYYKYLSAPNLIKHMVKKINDGGDANQPQGEYLDAIIILFLTTNYRAFSDLLAVFNSMLNIQELEMAQRRADYIDQLEETKQIMPSAGILPAWQGLDMGKLNLVSEIKNGLTSQLSSLKSYTSQNPIEKLKTLMTAKAQQEAQQETTLQVLKESLDTQGENNQMQALYIKGGSLADIAKAINETAPPSYEWPLCAGVCFIGEPDSLSFIKEVVSL